MQETLKELAVELAVIHESLERAEAVERREFAEERDQLRAEVERLRGENLKSRLVGVVDGFEAGASSEVKELEATVAGLRRALEEIARDKVADISALTGQSHDLLCSLCGSCHNADCPVPLAQAALAASSDEHDRRIKAEALNGMAQYLDSVAGDCNEDGHHQADLVPGLRSAANDCREAAKIVEAPNGR